MLSHRFDNAIQAKPWPLQRMIYTCMHTYIYTHTHAPSMFLNKQWLVPCSRDATARACWGCMIFTQGRMVLGCAGEVSHGTTQQGLCYTSTLNPRLEKMMLFQQKDLHRVLVSHLTSILMQCAATLGCFNFR